MNFPIKRLGDVADVSWGNTNITKASYVDEGFTAFSATGPDGYLPHFEHDGVGIVLSAIGARCGRCFLAEGKWSAIKNTITITQKDSHEADMRFLHHFLRRDGVWPSRGGGQPFIGLGTAQDVQVPFPPLSEQRRIAAILDKADAIRRKREEGIRLTEELLRSTFLEMFGDPARNPKGWEVRPFGELAKNDDGRRKPVKEADRAERHGEYPYYGASGIIDYVDEFLFNERTLLIAEDGANLLARSTPIAFIAEGKYWVNNHAHVVSDNGKADLDYLRFSLNLRKLNDFVTGSAQPKLNQASLNRIPIPLPPLPAQRKFAVSVRKLNELRDRRQSAANETTSLFGCLVQRAFRGEL